MSSTESSFNVLSLFEDEAPATLDISQDIALRVRNLQVNFRRQKVLKGVNFDVKRGEVLGFVGASGAGKSVLLRTMIGLIQPSEGTIEVFGQEFSKAKELREQLIERHWGILFQHGALFSALTVRQNVQFPMREYLDLSPRLLDEIAAAKLKMVGLPPEALNKMPSELSGGMIKRRRPRPRLGARSGDCFSGRTDIGSRSDQRRRIRQSHSHPAAYFGADGFHGNP